MKVEIEVVTGFLGAGKSALINSLIDETYVNNEKILVITLEKGNTKINTSKDNRYEVRHIEYDKEIYYLENTLKDEILNNKPNRIIVEYNGTERIENLLFLLYSKEISKIAKLSCIYFITDVKSFKVYLNNMEELLLPCIENSSLLVLNNCKNVEKKWINDAIKMLKERNLNGHIITSEDNISIKKSLQNSKLFTRSIFRSLSVWINNTREE